MESHPLHFTEYQRLFRSFLPIYFFNSFFVAGAVALSNIALARWRLRAGQFALPGRTYLRASWWTMMIQSTLFIPLVPGGEGAGAGVQLRRIILPAAINPRCLPHAAGDAGHCGRDDRCGPHRGAGGVPYLRPIVCPSGTSLAALAIFCFTWSWNASSGRSSSSRETRCLP